MSLSYSDAVRVMTGYEILVDGVRGGVPTDELVARVRDLELDPSHISAMTCALGSLVEMPPSVYERVARDVMQRYRLRN